MENQANFGKIRHLLRVLLDSETNYRFIPQILAAARKMFKIFPKKVLPHNFRAPSIFCENLETIPKIPTDPGRDFM